MIEMYLFDSNVTLAVDQVTSYQADRDHIRDHDSVIGIQCGSVCAFIDSFRCPGRFCQQ